MVQEWDWVTGQHDWLVKFLAAQVAILVRHCPLTGCYSVPCGCTTNSGIENKNNKQKLTVVQAMVQGEEYHLASTFLK